MFRDTTIKTNNWLAVLMPLGCLSMLTANVNAATIELDRLHCIKQEGEFFPDAPRLIITVDGTQLAAKNRARMRSGETWDLKQKITFNSSVEITLYDIDRFDPPDYLGSVVITPSTVDQQTGDFKNDPNGVGCHYRVLWKKADNGGVPPGRIEYTIRNTTNSRVTLTFEPSGNTWKLAANEEHVFRSPIENGQYPKVKAVAKNGKSWRRTIQIADGHYRIVKTADGGIQIIP